MIKNRKGVTKIVAELILIIVIVLFFSYILKVYVSDRGEDSTNFLVDYWNDFFNKNEDYQFDTCNPNEAINVQILEPILKNQKEFFINKESWIINDVEIDDTIIIKFSEPLDVMLIGLLKDVRFSVTQATKEEDWKKELYQNNMDCYTNNKKSKGYTEIDCKITNSNVRSVMINFPDNELGSSKRICKSQQKIAFYVKK